MVAAPVGRVNGGSDTMSREYADIRNLFDRYGMFGKAPRRAMTLCWLLVIPLDVVEVFDARKWRMARAWTLTASRLGAPANTFNMCSRATEKIHYCVSYFPGNSS
jgi:hypothetical protein